ncbi:MAG: Gfo/Idh/MocA family oxidoreductase [Chloroflexi bacterium]|nr:Gfo/Idh/MocA family oxidoreductase [Chloroflexota bacterium]
MQQLKTAILGCGGFANRHAQNIASLPEQFELVAFCDVDLARAHAFNEKYGAGRGVVFQDHHALFKQTNLDLCLICLPPFGHADEVEIAAQCGVHLLIEKPIALTSQHAWRMVQAAERAGIVTQVGFMYRFGAAVARLKELIDNGQAGNLGLMSAHYFCNHLHAPWWRDREKSGGQLVEQAIHLVDLMRYLMGEAATVYSLQNNVFHRDLPSYTVEDVSGTVIGFENGSVGVLYASNGAVPNKWLYDVRIVAKNLTAEFSNANCGVITHTNDSTLKTETISSDANLYLLELQDLWRAIVNRQPTRTPIREGARSLDLVLAAMRSAKTQNIERLP